MTPEEKLNLEIIQTTMKNLKSKPNPKIGITRQWLRKKWHSQNKTRMVREKVQTEEERILANLKMIKVEHSIEEWVDRVKEYNTKTKQNQKT